MKITDLIAHYTHPRRPAPRPRPTSGRQQQPAWYRGGWIVVEMSPLTNVIYRYWKGTDRDAWTVERDKAARYPDLENAERELAACLVREYRNVSVIKYD